MLPYGLCQLMFGPLADRFGKLTVCAYAMAAFSDTTATLTGLAEPERLTGEFVSPAYFSLLGIHAARGRTFRPEEGRVPQRDAVVVLSDDIA